MTGLLTPLHVMTRRFKFLAERCWAEMVELRPSLEVVMNELENLQKNLCPQVWGKCVSVLGAHVWTHALV